MTGLPATTARWQPDLLGEPFEQRTLALADDAEGEVVATLVRRRETSLHGVLAFLEGGAARECDILYIHGWSDYFFQTELAEFWHRQGSRFHALDLRKYGRSLREHQTPGYAVDLSVYDEDIEAALSAIGHGESQTSSRKLVLMGHSTGGLTLSLWADRHPGRAAALVLNSPWLEFQTGAAGRRAIAPLAQIGARLDPLAPLPNVDLGFYTRAVSREQGGEWEYNPEWRPARGFATHPAWLAAILVGHNRIDGGLAIDAPVFTMLSARSTLAASWSDAMRTTDSVLVVDDIARMSVKLGPLVTVQRFDGALHDVVLSAEPVRAKAYTALERWARAYLR